MCNHIATDRSRDTQMARPLALACRGFRTASSAGYRAGGAATMGAPVRSDSRLNQWLTFPPAASTMATPAAPSHELR